MLNENNNEDVVPAFLAEGEAVIPEDYNMEAVSDLIKDYIATVDQAVEPEEAVVEDVPVEEKVEEVVKPAKPEPKKKPKTSTTEEKIVAVFSTKNVTWNGVGKVNRGYNIVSQEDADKWSTRSHIRVATPEEVAREYGL